MNYFYHDDNQRDIALKQKETLQKSEKYKEDIVTEIISATKFYRAEKYHQDYLGKQGESHCHIN